MANNELDFATLAALARALGGSADPAVIEAAVSDWLDDHPEATTTVEDGSITEAKLDSNLKGVVTDVGDLKTAIEPKPVKGYNLVSLDALVEGYYYGSSIGTKIKYGASSSYRTAIVPVEKNTDYYVNNTPRFWAFTDDDDIVVSYGDHTNSIKGVVNSGNGTKLYFSQSSSIWDTWADYGDTYAIIIAKGNHGAAFKVTKPAFISGITQNMMDARYGCALPQNIVYQTVNYDQTWYAKNYLGLAGNVLEAGVSGIAKRINEGFVLQPRTASVSTNGYKWNMYDDRLSLISSCTQLGLTIKALNLNNCSALVIGDSTVSQDTMVQKMSAIFSEAGKTLTLLGTRGTSPYNHEGRAGWSAKQYCTVASVPLGTTNPFFNPTSEKFDFSYYMNAQSYASVDFVIVQLGINDLYNSNFVESETAINNTVGYIKEIIASIKSWNANQKILLNLPNALNDDQAAHTVSLPLIRNTFIRYNDAIQSAVRSDSNIRCSYCHLILDPASDISDDVHPTVAGYNKMAAEVVSQINCWQ